MKCTVLKFFRIATDPDGIQSKELNAGDIHDVPDDMVPPLQAEGYVTPIEAAAAAPIESTVEHPAAAMEIPADWASLKPKQQIKLAKALGVDAKDAAEAVAAIEAELARRSAAASQTIETPPAVDGAETGAGEATPQQPLI